MMKRNCAPGQIIFTFLVSTDFNNLGGEIWDFWIYEFKREFRPWVDAMMGWELWDLGMEWIYLHLEETWTFGQYKEDCGKENDRPSWRVHTQLPGTCEYVTWHSEGVFAEIKVTDVRISRLSWITLVDQI